MLSVHETGIKMQLVYIRKILTQYIRNLRYRVEPVFSGYLRGITDLLLENDKKTPCFVIIHHFVNKNSPNILLRLILGDKRGFTYGE